ncbi:MULTISPECIES: Asp-tRNA(Asn)/Glu-tRNA(Gln) amidotransferase subunit GatC [unclassified Breznakia]|uniref:Asp-tRNA(Asn)/Glu-tRNA(Gln) amidotransferase subunit GatC n=1 Tax=unclassified Breznakia TaxID=2623764 RepID=UPI002476DD47|nr:MULTISPECIES: Asp-tRNA(Asn)/Glu-tRNA(Gln) amidotransferase subunit GatC [unclassified Breznakia]MDH6366424.1 aspartyl-tRNA(Asn)/glutamyl-tRNA(Gln) amidotransferase subunit C [Breznakia sp. PH1-1]MDH6403517.1 aspartyl-tRNA(Asn)/glutamyl-tRNA(Gln) amidotransferase subunit C [Breznakia sp. PF1-11]MDH6411226.1 aspartyl-tRNA(Asn)/glutamyl-tRNA(Gln) amidotransferase subunit C [Breznakia sp. PFB1-11]MDH6413511.1 aspartyl-tRNA(Asn)/glutamyl-tRNA(Gln) amidotransferase subunit C [Breznakia sp. PFB1-14
MEKDKAYFRKLANQIMIDLSDDEIEVLQKEFEVTLRKMDLLDKINTDDVKEMVYPFELETHFLRKDEVENVISQQEALENAPEVKDGQILVPKVVK